MASELATIDQTSVPAPCDALVIAEQPGEMQAAQSALVAWATAKLTSVEQDLRDAEASLDNATACGVRLDGVKKLVKQAMLAVTYYEKVKSALEEGYVIVPDFPVEIVAIRTEKTRPSGQRTTSGWQPTFEQHAQALPEGEGEFVNSQATVKLTYETDEQSWWRASKFQQVALPVKFMKPRVLEATGRALAQKIFDEIGILPAQPKKDPIIVGRIIGKNGQRLSFLVAWFVDTRDL